MRHTSSPAVCLTTSGAIQYGVPTIVARLDFWSVSFAQKPKSAKRGRDIRPAVSAKDFGGKGTH